MRLLADSHVFVWASALPRHLSERAAAAIVDPDNDVFVSVASAWDLWIKHAKKPIKEFAHVLDGGAPAFRAAAALSRFTLLDISLQHAALVRSLPQHHGDPFDRLLVAQALQEGLVLDTHDDIFDRYAGLRTLKT
jgi:PIN domain nuclease of toxin-antitoxin system